MRDIHLLELAGQIGVNLKKDIHLLLPIEEFVRQRERQKDPWSFRIKADGGKYWINHKEMIASFRYPHVKELLEAVENHRKFYKIDGLSVNLKDYNPLQVLTELSNHPEVIKACKTKAVGVDIF